MNAKDDMRGEVLAVLGAAARKLLAVRAAESAAVGAVAGGLASAALEAAWTVGRVHPIAAVAFCALPAVLGPGPCVLPRLRRAMGLSGGLAALAAGICVVAALGGVACVLAGVHVLLPRLALPLALLPAGAGVGAAAALIAGVTPAEAGMYHDKCLGLEERLGTAAELAASRPADGPLARCVYAQALAAARDRRLERQPVWRRTRATAGALGLAVAMSAATSLLPTWGVADVERSFERVRDAAANLTAERRGDLADTLRRLQRQVRDDPRLLEALRAAVKAAENDMPEQLREELRRLQDALADRSDAEAVRIARALLRAMGLPESGQGAGDGGVAGRQVSAGPNTPKPIDANTILGQGGQRPLISRVYVYDKAYERLADANRAPAAATAPGGPAGSPFVPLTDAWSAARDRAAAALSAGSVPAEYRRLLRRFYELE